jgi:ABC-type lipoprotein release transport system permease subunit
MRAFRIGLLLGFRQIQRANPWTTGLIIFVMMLTFLNLIAVSGILVGLIVGSERAVEERVLGNIVISPLTTEDEILQTETIRRTLDTLPEVHDYTIRYERGASIEANYRTRRDLASEPNVVGTQIVGIDPVAEEAVTKISETVVEGSFFTPGESGYIVLGALLLERYTAGFADITGSLRDVSPGDRVLVTIGTAQREFTVKGIVNAKAGAIASRAYLPEQELRRMSQSVSRNADEIALRLASDDPAEATRVKNILVSQGLDKYARIRTFSEALPKFLTDIKQTFTILGTFIGAVGIIVASITIFIIIFINAVSRQRQIGILKGIGINARAIEVAYVLQAAFYALIGSALGLLITYGFLVGYFERNPINFPFSDGILVAEPTETLIRFGVLFVVTLGAGFLPAWLIVRRNTLNSILGRR